MFYDHVKCNIRAKNHTTRLQTSASLSNTACTLCWPWSIPIDCPQQNCHIQSFFCNPVSWKKHQDSQRLSKPRHAANGYKWECMQDLYSQALFFSHQTTFMALNMFKVVQCYKYLQYRLSKRVHFHCGQRKQEKNNHTFKWGCMMSQYNIQYQYLSRIGKNHWIWYQRG